MKYKEAPKSIRQQGFTIIELMIATAVFAVVMLIVTIAVLYVSNTFIKGDNEAQTQDIARSVLSTLTQDIEFNKATSIIIPVTNNSTGGYYCIGNHVYVYQIGQEVPSPEAHALLVFTSSCPNSDTYASYLSSNNVPGSLAHELLASDTRLGQLSIANSGSNSYQVSVTVAYGASDLLNGSGVNYSCKAETFGGQFCAVSTLTTTITSRIQ